MIPAWAIGALGGVGVLMAVGVMSYDMGKDSAEAKCYLETSKMIADHANEMAAIQFRIDEADKKAGEAFTALAGRTSTYREKIVENYRIEPDSVCLPLDRVQQLREAQATITSLDSKSPSSGPVALPVKADPAKSAKSDGRGAAADSVMGGTD